MLNGAENRAKISISFRRKYSRAKYKTEIISMRPNAYLDPNVFR